MKIDYLRFGEQGKLIVFLHGWQQNKQSFSPLVPFLYQNYRLFFLDLPGFGESDFPPLDFTSKKYADEIFRWIEKQKLKKVILVGHSFGGKIAAILTANHPQVVEKLVLIASAGILHPKWWYGPKEAAPKIIQKLISCILKRFFASRDYRQAGLLLPIFKSVVKEDCRPIFRKIKRPTLIIWGNKDQELSLKDGWEIKQLIKNSQLKIIEGGHFPFWQNPELTAKIINKFIQND